MAPIQMGGCGFCTGRIETVALSSSKCEPFMVTFDSEEGRKAYLPHPDHEAFVEILKPILDKPRVLDFWAEK